MLINSTQRVFRYGSTSDYALESVGIVAAIGSGVALAMVNLVMGNFINLLSGFTTGKGQPPSNFVDQAAKYSLVSRPKQDNSRKVNLRRTASTSFISVSRASF